MSEQEDKNYRQAMDYFVKYFEEMARARYGDSPHNSDKVIRFVTGAMFGIEAMKDAQGKNAVIKLALMHAEVV